MSIPLSDATTYETLIGANVDSGHPQGDLNRIVLDGFFGYPDGYGGRKILRGEMVTRLYELFERLRFDLNSTAKSPPVYDLSKEVFSRKIAHGSYLPDASFYSLFNSIKWVAERTFVDGMFRGNIGSSAILIPGGENNFVEKAFTPSQVTAVGIADLYPAVFRKFTSQTTPYLPRMSGALRYNMMQLYIDAYNVVCNGFYKYDRGINLDWYENEKNYMRYQCRKGQTPYHDYYRPNVSFSDRRYCRYHDFVEGYSYSNVICVTVTWSERNSQESLVNTGTRIVFLHVGQSLNVKDFCDRALSISGAPRAGEFGPDIVYQDIIVYPADGNGDFSRVYSLYK